MVEWDQTHLGIVVPPCVMVDVTWFVCDFDVINWEIKLKAYKQELMSCRRRQRSMQLWIITIQITSQILKFAYVMREL